VTNYPDPAHRLAAPRSRGALVGDFVHQAHSAADFLETALATGDAYDGFNLLLADATGVWYGSNRGSAARRLGIGLHGLSNHLIDTPWPKVLRAKHAMERALAGDVSRLEATLLSVLRDDAPASDEELPSTGVSLEWERLLSPVFIRAAGYGTRASTVVTVDTCGHATFLERTFDAAGDESGDVRMAFNLAKPISI